MKNRLPGRRFPGPDQQMGIGAEARFAALRGISGILPQSILDRLPSAEARLLCNIGDSHDETYVVPDGSSVQIPSIALQHP